MKNIKTTTAGILSLLSGIGMAVAEYQTTGTVQSIGEITAAVTTGAGLIMAKDFSQTGKGA